MEAAHEMSHFIIRERCAFVWEMSGNFASPVANWIYFCFKHRLFIDLTSEILHGTEVMCPATSVSIIFSVSMWLDKLILSGFVHG